MKLSLLTKVSIILLLIFLAFAIVISSLDQVDIADTFSSEESPLNQYIEIEVSDNIVIPDLTSNSHELSDPPTLQPLIDSVGVEQPIVVNASEIQGESSARILPDNEIEDWNPPSYDVPIAFHPNDHYWMIRPVSASEINYSLPYYHFGTDGPTDDYRLHHGIDLSNPIGVQVRAAASGTVIWADKGHFNQYEAITSYGNVIVIKHDFSYEGEEIFTLYAHLNEFLVSEGASVIAGEPIGTIGQTGNVTGPHVHFEVRVGRDFYYDVYNPELWISPYINTGSVLGCIKTALGENVYDADLEIFDPMKGYPIAKTSSYSGEGIQRDPLWQENFVLANIPEGLYIVYASYEDMFWRGEVTVIPGMSNWVNLVPTTPPAVEPESPAT